MQNTDWLSQAACKGQTALFFWQERETAKQRRARESRAKALCESCPVKAPCKQMGRDNKEQGVWGGENEEERYLAGYLKGASFARRRKWERRLGTPAKQSEVKSAGR